MAGILRKRRRRDRGSGKKRKRSHEHNKNAEVVGHAVREAYIKAGLEAQKEKPKEKHTR